MITAVSELGPVAAIGVFGGVPLLIFGVIAFVVSFPARRRRMRLRREIEARRAQEGDQEPAHGDPAGLSTSADRSPDAPRA